MTGRAPDEAPDDGHEIGRSVRRGLVFAGMLGLPLMALWTATGQIAGLSLPAIASPWDDLVPLFAAAAFLLASVRWLLHSVEQRLGGSPSSDEPVTGASGSRPCADCPP